MTSTHQQTPTATAIAGPARFMTNLAALRLSKDERLYPAWISAVGLVACGFLAFWVDPDVWLTGLGVLGAGLVLRPIVRAIYSRS